MTEPRRVAVTGMGVLAWPGFGQDAFWQGLLDAPAEGKRVMDHFDPLPWFDNPKEARRTDRFTQMALAAAAEALEQSGEPGTTPDRTGVWVGTGVGGLRTLEDQIQVRIDRGERRVSPFLVPMMMANAASAAISMRYGYSGPCENTVTACAAGTQSIYNAAQLIRSNRCDAVITGGTEASNSTTGEATFRNMTAVSGSNISRPFDLERDGFIQAEGAAILVLEELEVARGRGATVLGEIMGGASTADAHHITAPAPGGAGAVRCMELAVADAGLQPDDIVHINAHGTSTPLNDAAEAEAIVKSVRHAGAAGHLHQGGHRTRPGRRRGHRGRGRAVGHGNGPSFPPPTGTSPPIPTWPPSASWPVRRLRGHRARPCPTPSASGATTAPW